MDNAFEAIRQLMTAFNKIDGSYYFCAKSLGVKENTLAVLYALDDGLPHSQKQLSEEWLIPRTTVNTIVKELEKEGYITFYPEEESREKPILLTGTGKAYVHDLLKKVYAAEYSALIRTVGKFSPEFIDAFDFFASCLCEEMQEQVRK